MIKAQGIVNYSFDGTTTRIVIDVDPVIAAYARSLIPPYYRFNKPRYPPHITVARKSFKLDCERAGHIIDFTYDQRVEVGYNYYWLNVWSDDLIDLRVSMNLPKMEMQSRPPDGKECFHITIANTKNI